MTKRSAVDDDDDDANDGRYFPVTSVNVQSGHAWLHDFPLLRPSPTAYP